MRFDPSKSILSETSGIDYFFEPKSVAIIGATDRASSVGSTIMKNLIASYPKEAIYPINPKYKQLMNLPCFPSITEAPKTDLAIIVTPAHTVPDLVKECVERKVKAIIIISAGFKELGESGAALEKKLLSHIKNTQTRIIGPNCLGVMNPLMGLNATFSADMALKGNIAFISQSGAMCTAVLDWSFKEQIGFSSFVSIGSMCDVNWGDLIEYFGKDPNTQSILIYMESVGNARSFLSAAKKVGLTKPIILIKAGKTEAAAKAAASHTGSMAGSDDVLNAAVKRVGALRVDTISQLFDVATVLAKQPMPKGKNLTIITNAGGPSVLATDTVVEKGADITLLSKELIASLSEFLPQAWSHANPIDLLGDAGPKTYEQAIATIAQDPNSHGILVILTPQDMTNPTETAEAILKNPSIDKPLLTSWMGGKSVDKGYALLNASGIPCFAFPDQAAEVFALMVNHAKNLQAHYEVPAEQEMLQPKEDVAQLLDRVHKKKRTLLTELESKEILNAYGIPIVKTIFAPTKEKALEAAQQIGFPVALKLHSETITHKTDVGGVKLNIQNDEQILRAFKEIQSGVPKTDFLGVTVQEMISIKGYELILGSKVDPQFGPILLFGAGGELVEVMQDRAIALPPLNSTLATLLMKETKIYKALQGVRGKKSVDLQALESLLIQFSLLVSENPIIAECDINPLLASEDRLIALDARIVLHEHKHDIIDLAIKPYPIKYIIQATLKNKESVEIRPIKPEDEEALIHFHKELSTTSIYNHYFEHLNLEKRIAHNRLIQICNIDYGRDIRLVAMDQSKKMIGVVSITRYPNTNDGELKILILDKWHNIGLGNQLLKTVLTIAKKENFHQITGYVLKENHALIHLIKKFDFDIIEADPLYYFTFKTRKPAD